MEPPGTEEGRETDDNLEKNKWPRAKGSEYVMERGKKTSIESGRLEICSESPMFRQEWIGISKSSSSRIIKVEYLLDFQITEYAH